MALNVYQLHQDQLEHFLQGALIGGPAEDSQHLEVSYEGLFAKTLIFTVPLNTVTFVLPPSGQDVYPFQEVKLQIETQEPLLLVTKLWGRLLITRQIVTVGINLSNLGTANSILGFSATAITLGRVYNTPNGAPPRLLAVNQIGDGMFQVITDE